MSDQLLLSVRTILLIQLTIMSLFSFDHAFCLHQAIVKIWKKIRTPLFVPSEARVKKESKFWEIDMTKFEP